jgi:hypothetical protein
MRKGLVEDALSEAVLGLQPSASSDIRPAALGRRSRPSTAWTTNGRETQEILRSAHADIPDEAMRR